MHEQFDEPMETSMKTRLVFAVLIVGFATAVAAPSGQSLAQSTDQSTAAKSAKPNTNMTPHKHRAWRHQRRTTSAFRQQAGSYRCACRAAIGQLI